MNVLSVVLSLNYFMNYKLIVLISQYADLEKIEKPSVDSCCLVSSTSNRVVRG